MGKAGVWPSVQSCAKWASCSTAQAAVELHSRNGGTTTAAAFLLALLGSLLEVRMLLQTWCCLCRGSAKRNSVTLVCGR